LPLPEGTGEGLTRVEQAPHAVEKARAALRQRKAVLIELPRPRAGGVAAATASDLSLVALVALERSAEPWLRRSIAHL
jgi:hypothetical protein